jgi:hypothetical protein
MIQGGTTKLSKTLMYKIEEAGCIHVMKQRGEISVFEIEFGSNAYNTWKLAFLKNAEEPVVKESDPLLLPIPFYGIGPNLIPESEYMPVFSNAKDALLAYATLPKEEKNIICDIPLDYRNCNLPPGGIKFNHYTLALYKVMERIQSGIGLPAIAALPTGTFIVRLQVLYSNCMLSVLIKKA